MQVFNFNDLLNLMTKSLKNLFWMLKLKMEISKLIKYDKQKPLALKTLCKLVLSPHSWVEFPLHALVHKDDVVFT